MLSSGDMYTCLCLGVSALVVLVDEEKKRTPRANCTDSVCTSSVYLANQRASSGFPRVPI
jgi:hypothetical protein